MPCKLCETWACTGFWRENVGRNISSFQQLVILLDRYYKMACGMACTTDVIFLRILHVSEQQLFPLYWLCYGIELAIYIFLAIYMFLESEMILVTMF